MDICLLCGDPIENDDEYTLAAFYCDGCGVCDLQAVHASCLSSLPKDTSADLAARNIQ